MKMTYNGVVTLLVLLLTSIMGKAQTQPPVRSGVDLGAAFGQQNTIPSVFYHQTLQTQRTGPLFVGWGVRINGVYASDLKLSAKENDSLSDSLYAGKSRSNQIQLVLSVGVRIGKVADIGINTDLLGIAFGPQREVLYRMALSASAPDSVAALHNTLIGASPRFMNVNASLGSHHNGQNEAFLRLWLGRQIALKFSWVVVRVAYTSELDLYNKQRHFSAIYGMPQAALTIPLFSQ